MIAKYLILSIAVCGANASKTNDRDKCDNVIFFEDKAFENVIIKENINRPYQFSVHRSTNTLYFSYSVNEDDKFQAAHLNLDSKAFGVIDNISNGFATAINEEKNEIFIGGDHGIYVSEHGKHDFKLETANNTNIWSIYFKKHLYYITFPNHTLHEWKEGKMELHELNDNKVQQFIIDKNNDVYFANKTGLYCLKTSAKGDKDIKLHNENLSFRGFTLDNHGKVYFCSAEGVHTIDAHGTLKPSAKIKDVYSIAFDKHNHLVYGNSNSIVKLKPSLEKCKEN